jgi:hypothetical protein
MRYRRLRQFAAFNSHNSIIEGDKSKSLILIINVIAVIISLSVAGLSIHKPKVPFLNNSKIAYAKAIQPITNFQTTNTLPNATGCSCSNECDKRTLISPPFVHNGAGEFCWQVTYMGHFMDSSNLQRLNVNGVDLANIHTNEFPPARAGLYYIYYKSTSDTGHFEMK